MSKLIFTDGESFDLSGQFTNAKQYYNQTYNQQ